MKQQMMGLLCGYPVDWLSSKRKLCPNSMSPISETTEFGVSNKMSHLRRPSTSSLSFSRPRRLSNVSYTPISAFSAGAPSEAFHYDRQAIKEHGLSVATAAIFLAGEMAGSGVLALPYAMLGTGWYGFFLILIFTLNACYSGTRLGMCWVILEERYPEYQGIIRDPYPTIGEKAVGKWGRVVSLICICITLYGGGCVFIVLISQIVESLLEAWLDIHISICWLMVMTSAFLIPLTWLGTPKDFWPVAVGALLTTVLACTLIVVQGGIDSYERTEDVILPSPTIQGWFKAFAATMFAFAGASTFPTIQADMKERDKFNISAVAACIILFLIYLPMAAGGYFSYGLLAQPNIIQSISNGILKLIVEISMLLHLVAAYPILTNPPAQFFEYALGIPSEFNWKRCMFRSFTVLVLLFIAESIPSFGSILSLVGGSTVTLLTFVFPPYFYMKLCDASGDQKEWKPRKLPLLERIYCWFLIVLGFAGGCCATAIALKDIVATEFMYPCYIQSYDNTTLEMGSH